MKCTDRGRVFEVIRSRRSERDGDYVDAVCDSIVERCKYVGLLAAEIPADFVDGQASRGNAPSCRAGGQAHKAGVVDYISGCDGRRVGSVANEVSRRLDFVFFEGPVAFVVLCPNDFAV